MSEELERIPQDAPQSMLATVMRAVQDPTIDPARLREFLQIGRELEADKAKREWAIAFRAAKDEIDGVSIRKNGQIVYAGKNGAADSVIKFLKYDDLADAIKPILRKNNLTTSYTYRYESAPPKTICVLTILHAGGHSQSFESVPMPMVDSGGGKSDIQGAGSVMTYGRRYAIQAAFDIVAEGEDDDGSGQGAQEPITEEQATTIRDIVQACEDKSPGSKRRFIAWAQSQLKVSAYKEILQGRQHDAAMAMLKDMQLGLGLLKGGRP